MAVERPDTYAEAAALLHEAGERRTIVRPRGGGTKWGWGAAPEPDVVLSTARLSRVVEHNAGDLTAVLQAGVRLADAQAGFAAAGQVLALDPPLGAGEAATVGGLVATGDSGPLRHRYGAPRDLLLGMTVALSDGTVARSGGKVIKNVAGYDLAKLFAGSFGSLGTICEVVVRLHPLPPATVTVTAQTGDPAALAAAALDLAGAPLELEALDVRWEPGGPGRLLAQVGGSAATERAGRIAASLRLGAEVVQDDEPLWAAQRADQRSEDGIVVRVAGLPAGLGRALAVADRLGGSLVGRAAIGTWWITLPAARPQAVEELRRALAPAPCSVLDAPPGLVPDPWPRAAPALAALTRRVKERFDPAGACALGLLP